MSKANDISRIGVIGCGAIGSVLCRFIDEKLDDLELTAVCDIDRGKAEALANSLKHKPEIADIDALIMKTDMVIEAAASLVVRTLLEKCIKHKRHLMVMSVAGLIGSMDLLENLTARLFIPSGAICGIDGIKAADIGEIKSVTITTTKNPRSLESAPYIVEKKIDLSKIKNKEVIFEGNVFEAIKGFPQNVNVAATLSLAGIGPEKTKAMVIADPKIKINMHEIEVIGSFGRLTTRTENIVSPLNPKTSHLAVLSACATLKRLTGAIKIGT